MEIVLYQPLIPQNVGAIARTCAATGSKLHLIKPFPFELTDRAVKRAGLDYWHLVEVQVWENWFEYWSKNSFKPHYAIETVGSKSIFDLYLGLDSVFIFGKETTGLDENVLKSGVKILTIPTKPGTVRSLNLSNCVAITLYETLRKNNFQSLFYI